MLRRFPRGDVVCDVSTLPVTDGHSRHRGEDRPLNISIGKSVRTNKVKNQTLKWSQFVEKLQKPIVTPETIGEYQRMPREAQDKIKDVGYFVPAHYTGEIRKGTNLGLKDLGTLDFDHAKPDFYTTIKKLYEGLAFALYTTHKHTAAAPRFRLVFLFSRAVSDAEYPAIMRELAARGDINQCDDTTFQPSRVMHFASHSIDAEFKFFSNDGTPVDVDLVLSRYLEWQDIAEWPVSDRVKKRPLRVIGTKQQDPRGKTGVIGAFCNSYDMIEAMEKFLPGVYIPGLSSNRFTFARGTTSNGARLYDDGLFMYSEHESDPCSGRLVNAFDMVRLHKFAELDADQVGERASYKAMVRFAKSDEGVRAKLVNDRLRSNAEFDDFEVVELASSADDAAGDTAITARADAAAQKNEDDLEGVDSTVTAQIRRSRDDVMFLPNDHFEGPPAARRIFKYMGKKRELYRRGAAVVELDNENKISAVNAAMFRSRLNANSKKTRTFIMLPDDGGLVHKAKACSESTAAMLLACLETRYLMPIAVVSRSPVLAESAGMLKTAIPGYNEFGGGILVTSKLTADIVSLPDAVTALRELLQDFKFASSGDESRALVSLVSPCLRMGRLVHGDALIMAMEADYSQSGKGYFLKIVRQIYGEKAKLVAMKDGGVGGFDEDLSDAILSGWPFISFDNLRGHLNSKLLEMVLTVGDDPVSARVPYRGNVPVVISSISFQLTSNGVDATVDLANRLLVIRIRKQTKGYGFASFVEGDLLQHIEARRGFYLGCVHAVVREWYDAGKPELETDHSFRHWVGVLDWIATKVFRCAPLLEGHAAVIDRVGKPELTWLRQIGIAILKVGKAAQELRAGDLFAYGEDLDIVLPGARTQLNPDQGAQAVGRILARCFTAASDVVEVEDIRVTRRVVPVWDDFQRKEREQKNYIFESLDGL